jgi:phosphoribosylaminoimidazolecarboxamide formyltransferase/IMP cyclohydrolase
LTEQEKKQWIAERLTGVCMASDGFLPFRDNIDHAAKHGVKFIAQPGGSVRDEDVTEACRQYGISMAHTGLRLFHH